MWEVIDSFRAAANALSAPPRSTAARLKLKGIDEGARTSGGACCLIRRDAKDAYQGLTCREKPWEHGVRKGPYTGVTVAVVSSCREMLG